MSWWPEIGFADVADIAIVALFLYSLIAWFRRSRSAFVLIGMLIVGGIYVVGRLFGLTLTTAILQAFFAVILIAVVVIFQEEIRQFFERIASRSLLRGARRGRGTSSSSWTMARGRARLVFLPRTGASPAR